MEFEIMITNIGFGILILIFACLFVFMFDLQKLLTSDSYFSFSEFFVYGVQTKNIIMRITLMISYNCILFLVLNNFFDDESITTICIMSTTLGAILIVYPAFRNKNINDDISKNVRILYISFILFSFVLSTLVMLILILLFNDISINELWNEQKNSLILYFLLAIPNAFFNPINTTNKLKVSVENYRKEVVISEDKEEREGTQITNTNYFVKRINKIYHLFRGSSKND
ncbi:hypothetical protein EON06_11340 [Staphylococcus delphini]|uniref:hypothetical protein n=1 Tax=Staphylococcus delphini TaxID=53344 RepID=UPI0013626A81|nr:hypothetical protein [Staphylococcus delphini]NBK48320.1 hypothetical protein [Staphylococcus delphini]